MGPAIFVSFEGLDGAGKTTQIRRLKKHLVDIGRKVRVLREPGGTALGEQIREMLLHGEEVVPWAEASLFAAARSQLVELEIRPSLRAGIDVICDRYVDSSLAYQGWGRGLDVDAIRDWNAHVTEELSPDKTFLLSLFAEDVSPRCDVQLRLFGAEDDRQPGRATDRLERESVLFRRRIEEAYRLIARSEPDRVVALDARRSRAVLARTIRQQVDALIDSRPSSDLPRRAIALLAR